MRQGLGPGPGLAPGQGLGQGLDHSPAKGPGLGPRPTHSPIKSTPSAATNSLPLPPFHSPSPPTNDMNKRKQPSLMVPDHPSVTVDRDRGHTPGGGTTKNTTMISSTKGVTRGGGSFSLSSSSSSTSAGTGAGAGTAGAGAGGLLSHDNNISINGITDSDEILDLAGWRISTADFLSASAPVADSATFQKASRKELFSPSVFLTLRVLILRNNRLDNLKALHLHSALLPCLVEVDLAYNMFAGAIPIDALPDTLLRLDISNNAWDNIDALATCSTLATLLAQSNSLKALSQLPPRLEALDLSRNELCDCLNLRLLSLSPLLKVDTHELVDIIHKIPSQPTLAIQSNNIPYQHILSIHPSKL